MATRRGNGEGCITHEKSRNRWRAVYADGRDENGKLIRKNIYGKTRKEVSDKLNAILYQKNNSQYIKKNGILLIDVIDNLIENKYKLNLIEDRQYNTLKQHRNRIKKHKIANMMAQEITTADIQDFLYTIVEYSQSYIRKLISLLNCAFKDLLHKQIILSNPMDSIIVPRSKKDTKVVRALTFEEQKKFTEYLVNSTVNEEKYKNIFLFQMYLGMRIGEVLALKNTDFDLNSKYVYIRRTLTENKNGKLIMKNKTKTISGLRNIKIPDFLLPFVEEQLEIAKHNKDGVLFCYKNKFIRHNSVNSVLKRIYKTNLGFNDIEISSHMLRHTFATRCREQAVDMCATRDLLGHADIKETLDTYTQVQENFKNSEFDKVNSFLEKEIDFKPNLY